MAIRRTDVPLAPRLTLVVLFDPDTRQVALRLLREINGRREFESPRMTSDAVNQLARLRRQEDHAYLILQHPKASASLQLLIEGGKLYVHWDGVDYTVSPEEFAKAIQLPPDPVPDAEIGTLVPDVRTYALPDEYVDVTISHPAEARSLRVEKRGGWLHFALVRGGVAGSSAIRRDNLDLREEAIGDLSLWLTQGGIALRRISGGRCGVFERGSILGNIRLTELHEAVTRLGFPLFTPKPCGGRSAWIPRRRDDEWCEPGR